jgi:ADP-heptose:LPS heptosyltransferase
MSRGIRVPAGIGDSVWIFQKLINTGERYRFFLPDGQPQRGKQIFDLLPQLVESCTYTKHLGYNQIKHRNASTRHKLWRNIYRSNFYLSANEHLEAGKRIEQWLPDLPVSYTLDYATTEHDAARAAALLPGGPYIGIFATSYSTQRAWGFWDENGWYDLIRLMPAGYTFVIIGAVWDTDMGTALMARLTAAGVPFINTIGEPLSVVIEVLKRLHYFIGFPSGLSILNETLQKDTFMFYPPHLQPMINTWADPARIESGDYRGYLFCSPQQAFNLIKDKL